jgi:type VI secretion system secreted protein Hcp
MPAYMKYGDIKGDAKEPNHYQWIVIESVGWPDGRNASSNELVVTKRRDGTSPLLMRESTQGTGRDVTIALTKTENGEEHELLVFHLTNTLISSFSMSGETDQLVLNFEKIEVDQKQAEGYGYLTGDWPDYRY